jgi:oligopeptide transport system ATP-binding protein
MNRPAQAATHQSVATDRHTPLLAVRDLNVRFETDSGPVEAVRELSFTLAQGEALALVGESGSGKTQSAMALLGLLADNGRAAGTAWLSGTSLLDMPEAELRRIRGARIGVVFQDPMTALNPYLTLERQMTETLCLHRGQSRREARGAALRMLDAVRIADAARRLGQYPHELSGGMRQRVMIAMALLPQPDVLILDEPTTALDVTIQAQILDLLGTLRQDLGTAMLLITHDLGVVAAVCDRMLVMYAGEGVEQGPVAALLEHPRHPYTQGLLESLPSRQNGARRLSTLPGHPPDPRTRPPGCPFAPRCVHAMAICTTVRPAWEDESETRGRRCHWQPPATVAETGAET